MAKKYHPLDVRYKGPSTAYTGKEKVIRIGTIDRSNRDEPSDAPPTATRKGPWGKQSAPLQSAPPSLPVALAQETDGPPPNHTHRDNPPPLPNARAHPKSRNSVNRVLIGLAIMGLIVGANILATREYNGFLFDIETELNAIEL